MRFWSTPPQKREDWRHVRVREAASTANDSKVYLLALLVMGLVSSQLRRTAATPWTGATPKARGWRRHRPSSGVAVPHRQPKRLAGIVARGFVDLDAHELAAPWNNAVEPVDGFVVARGIRWRR